MAVLEATDCKANSRGRFKAKFRNVGNAFASVAALESFFGSFGEVKDVHLEDEMPIDDENLDDGKDIIQTYRYCARES
jgi:hypothetical protein